MIQIEHILDVVKHLQGLRAVVFDLDDTLYSEKEYVRSGYKAVAQCLPMIPHAEDRLWELFGQKKNAIDELLQTENIYTSELKQHCLMAYHNHIPEIKLYHGVRTMLEEMRQSGLLLGMITDGRPYGQRAKIAALNLEGLLAEIIVTDELGGIAFRKPFAMAYELMRERLSAKVPEGHLEYTQMAYVGDNIKKDFIAPLQLGIQAIHFFNSDGLYCH